MLILRDLTFDEGVEQFVRRNKMSSLPMTMRNTLIEEVFSKEKKMIKTFLQTDLFKTTHWNSTYFIYKFYML